MKSLKNWKVLTGIGLAIVIIAIAVVMKTKGNKVNTVELKRGDIVEAAYAVGTVKADHTYTLKTGVSSRVVERFVRVGDVVKKGDALINLDGFSVYRAPFEGVITAINYELGELVFAQTVVLTLTNTNSLYLELSMDERVISSVKQGQEARISFEGQRDNLMIGKVRSIYANDGQFLVLVDFPSKGMSLLPGMTSDVAIHIGTHKDKLLAPIGAISSNEIQVMRNGTPQKIKVKVGANDEDYAIVEAEGINPGDKVLVAAKAPASNAGGPQ